ncbi:MAG: Obg family GTPase CgtA [Arsenophonus sp.]|nr:MAG: Obg family GTPase CgtA [Arsenophonus sp.]
MNFVDEVKILVVAGNGGNGCISFRKEKHIRYKYANGGDGGDGGNVYFVADKNIQNLSYFKFKKKFYAESGKKGNNNNCTAKRGKDILLKVPLGTRIRDFSTHKIIIDMIYHKQKIMIAKGGIHGLGNKKLKSSLNRSHQFYHYGTKGEKKELLIELIIIADVGIIGMPNAGKSTLISVISNAKPKIASYPFTTLFPNLGVLKNKDKIITIADIPGLMKNASKGFGLGISFLKHLKRCKMLLHLVDISPIDGSDPVKNIKIIFNELKKYDRKLIKKKCWLIFNKIDLLENKNIDKTINFFIKTLKWNSRYYIISSKKNIGITKISNDIYNFLYNK